jgi:hypothetical protein
MNSRVALDFAVEQVAFSLFQLSDVCNTRDEYCLRHNRAARKSNLKMQAAPAQITGVTNATGTNA